MHTITHTQTPEAAVEQKVDRSHVVVWRDVFRVNCSCGFRTKWRQTPSQAQREASAHQADGQVTLDV